MRRNNWLTGILILSMPISLIYFLGSQMAYGQVQSRYAIYSELPEYARLADLQSVAAEETILLRGQLIGPAEGQSDAPLLLYQERPLDGREVRYQEEFKLIFPALALALADGGAVTVQPSLTEERAISHEPRRVTAGDREFTGFQAGDMITIQGKWQPASADQSTPALLDVTGISGVEKAILLAEVQAALQQVRQVRNGLGLLTLVSILLLAVQLIRLRKSLPPATSNRFEDAFDGTSDSTPNDLEHNSQEGNIWHPPTSKTVPSM